jgi:mannose/fructose/N-acetylgalactosamine-specific phosphotransferase system component IIB
MPISLYRVDERLIHGQVVVGWGNSLKLDQIVLANDQVAGNPWERELYLACVPPEIKATILSVDEATTRILQNGFKEGKTLILVDSPFDIIRMMEKGVRIDSVNVGGIGSKAERKKILSYIFLSSDQISAFKRIISAGIRCDCRDVPLAEKHDLDALFEKLKL